MRGAVWSSFLEEHTPTENEQGTHLAREERSHASLLYPATSSHYRVAFLHRLRVTPVIPVSRRWGSWAVHTPRTVLTRASLGWAWAAGSSGDTPDWLQPAQDASLRKAAAPGDSFLFRLTSVISD